MADPHQPVSSCLIGGALGDALGAPVEFMSLPEIRARFGAAGIIDLAPAYGRVGAITDDTQMTLFTAEGLLRADARWRERGICHVPSVVRHAYLRWLHTQAESSPAIDEFSNGQQSWPDGWLVGLELLHDRRAPGNTCLSALRQARLGSIEEPLNDSKGCGAVMRIAPVGLFVNASRRFDLGCEIGALTHGHPSGYLAAGFLASLIGRLLDGDPIDGALDAATAELIGRPRHDECLHAIEAARRLAPAGEPTAEKLESLGEGWVAEEALAMSIYCALVAQDFRHGVTLAVNHGGDSDSTGAITGNILGVLSHPGDLPPEWLVDLELRDEIEQLAGDLAADPEDPRRSWERYPGW
jgi:ADP-ribosyl-[dinitrogen reductase] hydrolase